MNWSGFTRLYPCSFSPRVVILMLVALVSPSGQVLADWTAADCGDGFGRCVRVNVIKRKTSTATDPCKNGSSSGDPVDGYSGAFVYGATDLTIPGRGMDLQIRRTYRNSGEYNGAFGYNWTFGYYVRARKLTSGNYLIIGDEGHELVFHAEGQNSQGENSYCGCEYYSHLIEHADATVTLFQKDGGRFEFNRNGALSALGDRFGNEIRFEYLQDGTGDIKVPIAGKTHYFLASGSGIVARDYQLVKIIDTFNREVVLNYYGASDGLKMGRLKEIIDYEGRTLKYDYDDYGNLIAVSAPATSDFPSGSTTHYSYFSFDQNEALNHNLRTITDGAGRLVLSNNYNSEDRIQSQTYGGGTTTWVYDTINRKTTVTDGNGNVTETTFTTFGNPFRIRQFTRGLRLNEPQFYDTIISFDSNYDLAQIIYPRGNLTSYSRSPEGNLLFVRQKPSSVPGADESDDILTAYTYEPIYNGLRSRTDPRGYTTTNIFDYQEGNNVGGLAAKLGISAAEVTSRLASAGIAMDLGDVNGDGRTDQINGRVIKTSFPTATVEGQPQTIESFYSYNDSGQPLTILDPEGNLTTLDYHPRSDPDGDGTSVPGQGEMTHDGYLKSLTRGDGTPSETTINLIHDPAGNLRSLTDGRGNTTETDYNERNQLTRIVAPAPFLYQVLVGYDETGKIKHLDTENKDKDGNLNASNPWITSTWLYDGFGRLSGVTKEIDQATTASVSLVFDAAGNLQQLNKPEGNRIRLEYDERNQLFKFRKGYQSAQEALTTLNYDLNGNLAQMVDPKGHSSTWEYDDFDRLRKIVNALGNSAEVSYDKSSNPTAIIRKDAASVTVRESLYQYDEVNRVRQLTRSILDAGGQVTGSVNTQTVYDKLGRVRKVTDANSHRVYADYDSLNRVTEIRDELGNKADYTYDSSGNILQRTFLDLDDHGGASSSLTVSYSYDSLNRLIRITDAFGRFSQLGFDSSSNLTYMTDREGNTASITYDGLRRPRSLARDLRNAAGTVISVATESYSYDRNSRLTEITDDNGNRTHFTYDPLDRITTQVLGYQSGRDATESYTHDLASNLATSLDPNGVTTVYGYDDTNRLTSRSSGNVSESYEYDSLSRLTRATLQTGMSLDSTVEHTYDSLGRVISERQDGKDVLSQYDDVGNRIRLEYPSGYFVTTTPTAIDQLDTIRDPSNTPLADYDFLGPSRPKRRAYSNGRVLDNSYDSLGRLIEHEHTNGMGAVLQGYGYGYDKVGNRVFEERAQNGGIGDVYKYDSLYQLTQGWFDASATDIQNIRNALAAGSLPPAPAVSNGSSSYGLDEAENRTSVNRNGVIKSYVRNALNEYDVAEGLPQIHDNNGNLIDDGTLLYSFDYANRLRTVRRKSDNGLIVTYAYDALNRRIAKQFPNGTAVKYIYDGARVIEERDQTDSVGAEYVYGIGLDEVVLMKRGGVDNFYHDNGLGSTVGITNLAGNLAEQYSYDHFGRPTIRDSSGATIPASNVGNPRFFAGQEFDPETGLYYNRARYLNPQTGRFISRDPLGPFSDPNLYAYTANNPVNYVDPSGLEYEEVEVGNTYLPPQSGLTPEVLQYLQPEVGLILSGQVDTRVLMAESIEADPLANIMMKSADFALGGAKFVIDTATEIPAMAYDLGGLSAGALGRVTGIYDYSHEVLSGAGRAAAADNSNNVFVQAGHRSRDMVRGLVCTPFRAWEAFKNGDYFSLGYETGNMVAIVWGVKTVAGSLKAASLAKPPPIGAGLKGGGLAVYDPMFAARQLLEHGQVSTDRLMSLVPADTPNIFKPSSTIEFGEKYQFQVNGTSIEVKFHSPDSNAAMRYPGSNSGTRWTAQIKVDGKLLGVDGRFYAKPGNVTHIPISNPP